MPGMRAWLLVAVLFACSKKEDPGPTCDQVVDHVLTVSKQLLVGHEGLGGATDRKAMLDQCAKRNMSKELRECLVAAKDLDGLGNCYKHAPQPPRPRTPVPVAPPPPAPTGSAGSGSG